MLTELHRSGPADDVRVTLGNHERYAYTRRRGSAAGMGDLGNSRMSQVPARRVLSRTTGFT